MLHFTASKYEELYLGLLTPGQTRWGNMPMPLQVFASQACSISGSTSWRTDGTTRLKLGLVAEWALLLFNFNGGSKFFKEAALIVKIWKVDNT